MAARSGPSPAFTVAAAGSLSRSSLLRRLAPLISPSVLYGFIGRTSSAQSLRASLDVSAERTRAIASRVAQASLAGDGFALNVDPVAPGAAASAEPVDVEAEMANLADEQLHFEATAKLLQKTYERLRSTIRER